MEIPFSEVAEKVAGRISTGLVIAAAIIGLAIYARPSPPRYQAVAADGRIVRIDTRSGTIIACEGGRCATVLRRGQRLDRNPAPAALPKPAAPAAQPALPRPAP